MNKQQYAIHILKDTRELLSSPNNWIKGKFAEDMEGNDVSYISDNATAFCMTGALMRCSWNIQKTGIISDYFDNVYIPMAAIRIVIDIIIETAENLNFINEKSSLSTINDDFRIKHDDILNIIDISLINIKR